MAKTTDRSHQLTVEVGRRLREPWLEPLEDDPAEQQQFLDFELTSCVETRCAEIVDPQDLAGEVRERWLQRALNRNECLQTFDGKPRRCFWLRSETQRFGTVEFSIKRERRSYVLELSSLYVRPEQRRQGWARRAMEALQVAARAAGVHRIRLRTEWCARPAMSLYCSLGMWLDECGRSMVFVLGRDMPKWRVDITGDVARFVVGNTPRELIRAERRGQRLRWRELPELERPCHRAVRRRAAMTFAIALAMQGWPLQRERESDIQDGLSAAAFGVQFGEAWFRMNRWVVRTPQIPGLPPIALFML